MLILVFDHVLFESKNRAKRCALVCFVLFCRVLRLQVGIAKEKVVDIDRLSDLAAVELFVASAPREVRQALPTFDGSVGI